METTGTPESSGPSSQSENFDIYGFLGSGNMDYTFPDLSPALYPHFEYGLSTSSPTAVANRPHRSPTLDSTMHPAPHLHRSTSDISSDGRSSRRASPHSGANSPGPSNFAPRSQRPNPIQSASPSSGPSRAVPRTRRRATSMSDDDDDAEEFAPAPSKETSRREEIRQQRIESEQRRRDELRDAYRRLKDALPVSTQKSSKIALLDRAATHIKYLEMTLQQVRQRLTVSEAETQRLRTVNEALMLGTAEQRSASASLAAAAVSLAAQVHARGSTNDGQSTPA